MQLVIMAFLAACDQDTGIASTTDTVSEDSGWGNYGDSDADTDADSDSDSDSDGDTDTDPQPAAPSECQNALMATTPAYPVFPAWDGRAYVNLTVTLTGATKPWATVSWGSESSEEGWWISCVDIIGGSTALIPVEAMGTYGASTFGNQDPADGSTSDANGFWWYPWSITGGDLGGTKYVVQVDGETVNLVEEQPAE